MGVEKKEGEMQDGKITEEGLDKLRDLIGKKLRITQQFNDLASKAAIRNYVNGIGDVNPLYRDPEYAKNTRYGRLIAPPNWLYSVFPTWVSVGLPGVHGFHSGNDWEFYKPVYEGDTITPECIFEGFDDKKSQFAGRIIILKEESRFYNQTGDLVAKTGVWSIRAERHSARGKGKYSDIQLPHPYTEEEMKKIEEEVLAEEIRGSKIRYWEDVDVGEELPPVVKGIFGLMDMIAYTVGASPVQVAAHGAQLRFYQKHPAWSFRDTTTNALEPIYAVHFNKLAANTAGLPLPYDAGAQRQGWLIQLLTNWMGDDGWLKKNYAQYRKFVFFSDTVWFTGKVVKKYVDEDGEYCVDIETHGFNQRGEDTVPGQSTVVLPSRDADTWPLEGRLV
jgi:acyl dehydratase